MAMPTRRETILGRSKAVNQQGEHYKKLQMLTHTREMLLKACGNFDIRFFLG